MPQRKKYDDIIGDFTALVVEDESIVALDLKLLLESLGAREVLMTARADEAHQLIKGRKFDICLLDYHLDDGTSGSVAKLIMDMKIALVFISGNREFIVKLRGIDQINILQKPFSHKEVKIAVARALGTRLPESAQD